MTYTMFELLWLFILYSFMGWVMETVATALKKRRFSNRGLVNGPFCIIYGFTAVILTVFTVGLNAFWVFIGGTVLATLIEWTSGHLVEKIYHERWWDYSGVKFNLDGYICVPMSVFWGMLGVLAMKLGNPVLLFLLNLLPGLLGRILILTALGLVVLDVLASLVILSGRSRAQENWKTVDDWLTGISTRFGKWIYRRVDRRIRRAYPDAKTKEESVVVKTGVFAEGCGFYKLFLLFVIGAFLGDIVETVFCRITTGIWMSRSSLVWGPFSVVWGIGLAGATLLLYKYRNRSSSFLFCVGVFLGGTFEYICSVFTEIFFGKIFWDYSAYQFNLGGRINLLFCFFWGIAAVVWFKKLYRFFSCLIEKCPVKPGKIITWLLVVFMLCNVIVSCMALVRYDERSKFLPPQHAWQRLMDERFHDERMELIYPNAKKPK